MLARDMSAGVLACFGNLSVVLRLFIAHLLHYTIHLPSEPRDTVPSPLPIIHKIQNIHGETVLVSTALSIL
ncbi:hypothetical protein ARMGADRAFT_815820 [Armillaria gallica]|uniref:Uncharacterized protein n=1 Tax=Armillaria gallica TaxID=47427 RepID=A0A2H3CWE7_ARMGA|nr:hypothetical protein ARMGADRAFT_815820 [Armillaria gallica]